ncbi:hypothetical protein SAC12B_0005 [Lactobacillus phage SAC12B]|uniref:Uncharacterized protein n=1 Tax=Lactobacillus phage SAC12B TaxID=2510941 RepID=A0A4Y5FI91_9CAUD|nr:hypothetical protein HWC10_gp005 [Lactobacillus phage SAC12B]QBJ03794.1 hypothetical protein SAC12B_0005 [Lactobacillus phage SAC12B]
MKIRELLSLDGSFVARVGQRNVVDIYITNELPSNRYFPNAIFYEVVKDNGSEIFYPREMFISVWEKD